MKEVPFVNRRYAKGVPFSVKNGKRSDLGVDTKQLFNIPLTSNDYFHCKNICSKKQILPRIFYFFEDC